MDEARRIQLEVFRRMTPGQRIQRGLEMSTICLMARDQRLRRQNPEVTEEVLRLLLLREILGLSPTDPIP